jgi:hypothetical protein
MKPENPIVEFVCTAFSAFESAVLADPFCFVFCAGMTAAVGFAVAGAVLTSI